MLLCKFASSRSSRDRIERWVDYLMELELRNAEDPAALRMLQNLRQEAAGWVTLEAAD